MSAHRPDFEDMLAEAERASAETPIEATLRRAGLLCSLAEQALHNGCAEEAVRAGLKAIAVIEQSETSPPHLIAHLNHERTFGVSTLWSLVAQAQFAAGSDPHDALALAREALGNIGDGYWTASALIELATAEKTIGADPSPTLHNALVALDGMPQEKDYDLFDAISRELGYEELVQVQAVMGFADDARLTLSRLEQAGKETQIESTRSG